MAAATRPLDWGRMSGGSIETVFRENGWLEVRDIDRAGRWLAIDSPAENCR